MWRSPIKKRRYFSGRKCRKYAAKTVFLAFSRDFLIFSPCPCAKMLVKNAQNMTQSDFCEKCRKYAGCIYLPSFAWLWLLGRSNQHPARYQSNFTFVKIITSSSKSFRCHQNPFIVTTFITLSSHLLHFLQIIAFSSYSFHFHQNHFIFIKVIAFLLKSFHCHWNHFNFIKIISLSLNHSIVIKIIPLSSHSLHFLIVFTIILFSWDHLIVTSHISFLSKCFQFH